MKKLAIATAVALALPVMANAAETPLTGAQFLLNDAKNSVKVASYGICYGMKASFKGKPITRATPGFNVLGARLTFVGDQPGQDFQWDTDFLLNNVDPASGEPDPADVVITGTIGSRSNDTFVLDLDPADQLTMATALVSYAGDFPEFLGNAQLTNQKPNTSFTTVKPVTPYSLTVKVAKGKATVTEVSNVISNQGSCSSFGTITRKYIGLSI